MSEEGIDDAVDRTLRQLLAVGGQIAERVARLRQELLRKQQQTTERANQEYLREIATGRANMRAVLAPVNQPEWWNKASAEQVAGAYQVAEAWKDYDPSALEASTRIRNEVKTRYGIDTADLQGDREYLRDAVDVQHQVQHHGAALVEEQRKYNEAMTLVAAAQAAELQREAQALRGEMDHLQVPNDYLADPELLKALKGARDAPSMDARTDAERVVAERMHLIKEDGLQGPTIDQLREDVGRNYSGVGDSFFNDAAFVAAAKDWHEARVLAEGGFINQDKGLEARYETSEKELFDHIASLGHAIENDVLKGRGQSLRDAPGVTTSDKPTITYASAEHRAAFTKNLEGTASPEEINGRLVAAADQGRHPREAVRQAPTAPKQRWNRKGAAVSREVSKGGPAR